MGCWYVNYYCITYLKSIAKNYDQTKMKVTNGHWNKFGPYQLQNTESGLLDLEIDTALTCDDVEKSWCRSNSLPAGLVLQPLPLGVSFHKT